MKEVVRIAVCAGVLLCCTSGWAWGHIGGAVVGLVVGSVALAWPWCGQPLWRWASHYIRRNRASVLPAPITVTNDRSGGGVRYHDGVAVSVVQLLGKPHCATLFTGSATSRTDDVIDVTSLLPMLRQSLGLTIESISVISAGSRRRSSGDYPRVYDTLLGPAPYAGSRATWLVVRIPILGNGDALQGRRSVGTATLAAAQRVASALRCSGIRAKVATATDIVELDRRLGASALERPSGHWRSVRGDSGWMTSYAYQPTGISSEALAQAWTLKVDSLIQNVTVFSDGTCCAAVTVGSAQPPTASPSVALKSLPGEQSSALANNLCGPRRDIHGQGRGWLPSSLLLPIGPSGILLGKVSGGDRFLLPLGDPGEPRRVRLLASDAIAKRIVIRAAAAGERITLHTNDIGRWESIRMPHVMLTERSKPASDTTLSVTDGTVTPAPRPQTVVEIGEPGSGCQGADVSVVQTGPATVEVRSAGEVHEVEVELFRAENRYVSTGASCHEAIALEMAGWR